MTAPGGASATWAHQAGRCWTLVDGAGRERGTFDRPGPTLRRADAVIDGRPLSLSGRGLLTRHLSAASTDGAPAASIEVGALRWRGRATLAGGVTCPLQRIVRSQVRFTVGDPRAPLLTMDARRRRADLVFAPELPQRDPALLALMVLLLLHHERSTSAVA